MGPCNSLLDIFPRELKIATQTDRYTHVHCTQGHPRSPSWPWRPGLSPWAKIQKCPKCCNCEEMPNGLSLLGMGLVGSTEQH
jgi:hypothetical protein